MKAICFVLLSLLLGFHSVSVGAIKSFPSCKSCEAKAKPIRRTTSFKRKTYSEKISINLNTQLDETKKP